MSTVVFGASVSAPTTITQGLYYTFDIVGSTDQIRILSATWSLQTASGDALQSGSLSGTQFTSDGQGHLVATVRELAPTTYSGPATIVATICAESTDITGTVITTCTNGAASTEILPSSLAATIQSVTLGAPGDTARWRVLVDTPDPSQTQAKYEISTQDAMVVASGVVALSATSATRAEGTIEWVLPEPSGHTYVLTVTASVNGLSSSAVATFTVLGGTPAAMTFTSPEPTTFTAGELVLATFRVTGLPSTARVTLAEEVFLLGSWDLGSEVWPFWTVQT